MNTYKGFSRVIIEGGKTKQLWFDQWDNRIPEVAFPKLFSFVMNNDITMRQAKEVEYTQDMFHTPMLKTTYEQYQILIESLQRQQISDQHDKWVYTWGTNNYSTQNAYKQMFGTETVHPALCLAVENKMSTKTQGIPLVVCKKQIELDVFAQAKEHGT